MTKIAEKSGFEKFKARYESYRRGERAGIPPSDLKFFDDISRLERGEEAGADSDLVEIFHAVMENRPAKLKVDPKELLDDFDLEGYLFVNRPNEECPKISRMWLQKKMLSYAIRQEAETGISARYFAAYTKRNIENMLLEEHWKEMSRIPGPKAERLAKEAWIERSHRLAANGVKPGDFRIRYVENGCDPADPFALKWDPVKGVAVLLNPIKAVECRKRMWAKRVARDAERKKDREPGQSPPQDNQQTNKTITNEPKENHEEHRKEESHQPAIRKEPVQPLQEASGAPDAQVQDVLPASKQEAEDLGWLK